MIQSVEADAAGDWMVQIVNRRGEISELRVDDILAAKFFPR